MNTKYATYLAKPVQLRLKPELHEWVHKLAQAQERSANWIINKVLEDAHAKPANLTFEAARRARNDDQPRDFRSDW